MRTAFALIAAILACLFVPAAYGSGFRPAAGRAVMPRLDPATHPVLRLVTTDKAVYPPGAAGRVQVTIDRPGSWRIVATMYRDITPVAEASGVASVPASGIVTIDLPFAAPAIGERGYRVAVTASNGQGTIRDTAMTAIDVQTTKLHTRFPRQCWVSHWDGAIDAASLIASQVAWHCNIVQSYASYYRPELAARASQPSWRSLSNLTVSRAAIRDVIAAAHASDMPVGFFQAVGEAYANPSSTVAGPSLTWGSFRNRCGLRHACTSDDLDRSPPYPDHWRKFGWQADHLEFFDPCHKGWQAFLLSRSIRPMIRQFGFDFWQADTVGAPVQPTFDAGGRPLDTSRCLTDFTARAQVRLGVPVVLNTVSGWGLDNPGHAAVQPYLYRETWNFDTPYYPGLNGLVAALDQAMGGRAARAIIQPGYINRTLAEACAERLRTEGCIVNPHAALLATAMFAIAGSTWMNHADQGCILTNVFVEGYHLPCLPALVDALLSYKAFEVAYEAVLRDVTRDSGQPCEITSAGKGGSIGAAGEVYLLGKTRPGVQICQLLNLTGVSSNDWTDLDGTKERPTPQGPLSMKLYYAGKPVRTGRDLLWWASPDQEAGAAQSLSFRTGTDERGRYINFVLPTLRYWDMIVLQTGAVT